MINFKLLFKYFFLQLFSLSLIMGLIFLTYYGTSDKDGLFSETSCLKFAEEMLDRKLFPETCERKWYENEVRRGPRNGLDDISGYVFKFQPLKSKAKACPAVTFLVDRQTGEIWVTQIDRF